MLLLFLSTQLCLIYIILLSDLLVFKVYAIEEDKFTEKFNLRPAQRPGLNYVAVDIVWSPREENILASASSNGSVVFWDINKPNKHKQGEK